jgi:outer membrane protein TolC
VAAATLAGHPVLTAQARRAEAGKFGVDLARQQSRPNWAIDVSYGFRQGEDRAGDDRPDFFSAMLSFDMPIFPKNRQDRRVSAAMATELEMKSLLKDRQRVLRRSFESAWADENVLEQRVELFENRVLPSALANVEATRQAYRNDVVLFDELVRSEKSLLDTRMRLLRLRADHALSTAELLYLTGESR